MYLYQNARYLSTCIVIYCSWPYQMLHLTLLVDIFNLYLQVLEVYWQNHQTIRYLQTNELVVDDIKRNIWVIVTWYNVAMDYWYNVVISKTFRYLQSILKLLKMEIFLTNVLVTEIKREISEKLCRNIM